MITINRVLIGGNSILNEVNFVAKSALDENVEASGQLDDLKIKQAELLKVLNCSVIINDPKKLFFIFEQQFYHEINLQTVKLTDLNLFGGI